MYRELSVQGCRGEMILKWVCRSMSWLFYHGNTIVRLCLLSFIHQPQRKHTRGLLPFRHVHETIDTFVLGNSETISNYKNSYCLFVYVYFWLQFRQIEALWRIFSSAGEIGKGSYILSGSGLSETNAEGEVEKIHQENVEKLASMSHEEIMKEREQLLASLGNWPRLKKSV